MRKFFTILTFALFAVMLLTSTSCDKNEIKFKKKDNQNFNVEIKCVNLTVKVVDEKNNNIKGCKAKFRTHNGGYVVDWWDLPDKGEYSKALTSTNASSWLDIKLQNYETTTKLNGINENTTVVFIYKPCNQN